VVTNPGSAAIAIAARARMAMERRSDAVVRENEIVIFRTIATVADAVMEVHLYILRADQCCSVRLLSGTFTALDSFSEDPDGVE
jgi:hypothetical protein